MHNSAKTSKLQQTVSGDQSTLKTNMPDQHAQFNPQPDGTKRAEQPLGWAAQHALSGRPAYFADRAATSHHDRHNISLAFQTDSIQSRAEQWNARNVIKLALFCDNLIVFVSSWAMKCPKCDQARTVLRQFDSFCVELSNEMAETSSSSHYFAAIL